MEVSSVTYITGTMPKHRHFHDNNQLIYIVAGKAKITVNGISDIANAGDLIVLGRFEKHSVLPLSSDFCRYSARLLPEKMNIDNLYSIFLNRPDGFTNIIDMSKQCELMNFIFKSLADEYNSKKPMGLNMSKLLIDMLLINVYRSYPDLFTTSQGGFETVFDIQRKFETDFASEYSLSKICKEYNMSISYLSHSFKKITGLSVMDYLFNCRLTNAKKLLANTDLPIGTIVEKCGFSDSSNFSRAFRQQTGISPSEFRKKYK